MAKKEASAPVKKKRGSRAVTVFNVLFIIVLVIAVVVGVLMFTPASKFIKNFLQGQQWLVQAGSKFVSWVDYHIVRNLGLTMPFRGHSQAFTACLYVYAYSLLLFVLLFLMYTPFLVMNHNRKLGRKGGFRKALCWFTFVVTFLVFLGYLSVPYTQKITSLVGKVYSWFPETYNTWKNLFATGQILSKLRLSFISNNLWFNATFYILVLLVLFQIIFYIMACKIKGKERVEDIVEEKKEEAVKEEIPATAPVVAPVVAQAEDKKEEKPVADSARVAPTIRELAILNSLEPIEASPISNLPGLYDTEVEKLIDLLEPQYNEELAREDATSPDAIEAKRLSETIQPNLVRSIQVLPGIDEWGATPWADDLDNAVKPRNYNVKILPGIDEWKADPWAEDKIKEEKIEEVKEEEVTEPVQEAVTSAPVTEEPSEVKDITDIVAPETAATPVVEEVETKEEPIDRTDRKVVVADNSHEDVETKKFEKDNEWTVPDYVPEEKPMTEETIDEAKEEKTEEPMEEDKPKKATIKAVNFLAKDGKRPQEEEHEFTEKEIGESRLDHKQTVLNNTHKEIKTEKFYKQNDWKLPDYVPEEKPAIEEKKAEPVKPVANVKQVELKQAPVANKENKPKIVPIAPIAPKPEPVKEEPVEEVKEEKVLTPISGPLHSTAKSKHDKIEAVKAKKVRFELRNYQIKTFEGDITAEEAFRKGVTKVQPTVNPVFANQANEPEWKQKRRNEEIRKNGYSNVTMVDKLNGNVPAPTSSLNKPKSPLSIRELAKAQKAEANKPEEETKKDEAKIAKPAAPISLKPTAPVKPVENNDKLKAQNPFSDKQVPTFHPIAPINKKPNSRPTIKPVDPLKKK